LRPGMRQDVHNVTLLENAKGMTDQGRLDEAEAYLRAHADPSGRAYPAVQAEIEKLAASKAAHRLNQLNLEASKVVSRLGNRLKSYHAGAPSVEAKDILQLVERLKTEFAGTENAEKARETWPAWFAGKVPRRGVDVGPEPSPVEAEWNDALARARTYEKEWRFREARETVERFLASREPTLGEEEVARYRAAVQENVTRLERSAESVYTGQERQAWDLLKNKRYDQAIAIYRKIVESFGLDAYVRKAQDEIRKIEAQKPKPAERGGG
ncbi:MAG: hypothetical protein ACREID_05505, partial [Planctomycetota bacterium]